MAKGQLHLSPQGPTKCTASSNESCHYSSDGHFDSAQEAEKAFEDKMGGIAPKSSKKFENITISSNIGEASVIDGDLSNSQARAILSSGLCGDLALAIHEKTGGSPYFLTYHDVDSEELQESFQKNPDSIFDYTAHVVMESPTKPNHFVDSYGQKGYDDFDDFWGSPTVVEGSVEMLRHFADAEGAKKLENFASTAIELDKQGISYDYSELDEYSDEDYDEDEESDLATLHLDFGSIDVSDGDLSDPKVRSYFANGLCLDLAKSIQKKTGGDIYFVVDSSLSEKDLNEASKKGSIHELMSHAVVESPTKPGTFMDGYGVQKESAINEFFGGGSKSKLVKASSEHIDAFPTSKNVDNLDSFAEMVLYFDKKNISYDYNDFG